MQIQADAGRAGGAPRNIETTVLGAAYLAGLGAGIWTDRSQLARSWEVDRRFEPAFSEAERESRIALWTDAVERARSR